ncbi:hypothetical protein OIU79_011883 [Salix purpurea]|uniref:Uncharacterized protein n=1 Tax=Salix purpurea TaxID=77065 RepID=A0A9Q0Q1V7_SALPP|nr:hypothetical protein OIU79_011883 [Salix purpurea]
MQARVCFRCTTVEEIEILEMHVYALMHMRQACLGVPVPLRTSTWVVGNSPGGECSVSLFATCDRAALVAMRVVEEANASRD